MNWKILWVLILTCGTVKAESWRATEMTSAQWSALAAAPTGPVTVEFRQGDVIPVSFSTEGDFFETPHVGTSDLRIKKSFWLKVDSSKILASADGINFRSLSEVATGTFTAGGWSPSGPINSINLLLQAYRKAPAP